MTNDFKPIPSAGSELPSTSIPVDMPMIRIDLSTKHRGIGSSRVAYLLARFLVSQGFENVEIASLQHPIAYDEEGHHDLDTENEVEKIKNNVRIRIDDYSPEGYGAMFHLKTDGTIVRTG